MPKLIKDEFTNLQVSRQRKYQLRCIRDGKCLTCGADAKFNQYCFEHAVKEYLRQRVRHRSKKMLRSKLIKALQASNDNRRDVLINNLTQQTDDAPPKKIRYAGRWRMG